MISSFYLEPSPKRNSLSVNTPKALERIDEYVFTHEELQHLEQNKFYNTNKDIYGTKIFFAIEC